MSFMDCYKENRKLHTAAYSLRACMSTKPLPKPTSMRELIHRQTGCARSNIHIGDAHFDPITSGLTETFLAQDETDLQEYIAEKHDCLLPDTALIAKYNGTTAIVEIEDLYRIQWFHKNLQVLDHEQKWTHVNWIRPKQSDKNIIVRSQHGHLKLTEDHKVKCDGEYHKLSDLDTEANIEQIQLSGIFNNNIELNTELAWTLGLFYADGYSNHLSPTKTQSHHYPFEIVNTNRDFLEHAHAALTEAYGDIFEIQSSESDKVGNTRGGITLRQQQFHLRIASQGREKGRKTHGNKEFVCKIMPHLYTLSHNKIVPSFILNATKEVKKAYLEGVWAGDGSKRTVHKQLTVSSEIGSLGLQILLEELGEDYKMVLEQGKNAWSVNYGYIHIHLQNNKVETRQHSGIVYDINTDAGELAIGNFCCKNCEDFARRLGFFAHEYFFKKDLNAAFCEIWGPVLMKGKIVQHGFNGFVAPDMVLRLIEPQTDWIYPIKDYLRGRPSLVIMR